MNFRTRVCEEGYVGAVCSGMLFHFERMQATDPSSLKDDGHYATV